jgi:hypothetical protein
MTTALEQQREDAALGAAWRRAEAALPSDEWFLQVSGRYRTSPVVVVAIRAEPTPNRGESILAEGEDVVTALTHLAERLND